MVVLSRPLTFFVLFPQILLSLTFVRVSVVNGFFPRNTRKARKKDKQTPIPLSFLFFASSAPSVVNLALDFDSSHLRPYGI